MIEFNFNRENIKETIDDIKQRTESYLNSPSPRGVRHRASFQLYDPNKQIILSGSLFKDFRIMVKTMYKIGNGVINLSLTPHPF